MSNVSRHCLTYSTQLTETALGNFGALKGALGNFSHQFEAEWCRLTLSLIAELSMPFSKAAIKLI